jgi:hypothetical protein
MDSGRRHGLDELLPFGLNMTHRRHWMHFYAHDTFFADRFLLFEEENESIAFAEHD